MAKKPQEGFGGFEEGPGTVKDRSDRSETV